jgi:8-oxo-dGTP pyrophosphatase MutT (NUDIX family)
VLKRCLRPGGQLEHADGALVGAAVREVGEETGIPAVALRLVDEVPVDIDVHPIPANPGRGEPDHWHFDVCFAFTTTAAPEVRLQTEEVHDFRCQPAAASQPGWLAGRIIAVVGREAIVRADR